MEKTIISSFRMHWYVQRVKANTNPITCHIIHKKQRKSTPLCYCRNHNSKCRLPDVGRRSGLLDVCHQGELSWLIKHTPSGFSHCGRFWDSILDDGLGRHLFYIHQVREPGCR
jgi:hypothetical protein